MRTFGNIIWHFPFLGFIDAVITFCIGLFFILTVVGAPIGIGLLQLSKFLLAPFTQSMVNRGFLNERQSILWKSFGMFVWLVWFPFGLVLWVMGLIRTIGFFISIIGIPEGIVMAKSLSTIWNPVNKKCVHWSVAEDSVRRRYAEKRA